MCIRDIRIGVRINPGQAIVPVLEQVLLMGGIGLAALLVGLVFAWSARSITRPLGQAVAIATRVAYVAFAAEVPNVLQGDPLRLGQMLINLTNNAIKFTKKG